MLSLAPPQPAPAPPSLAPNGASLAPNAQPYLAMLMTCDGNLNLAAERLAITASQLIMEIARDPEAQPLFDRYLRLYASLKAFQSLADSQAQLHFTIHELTAPVAARHFTTLLTVIENFTKRTPPTSTSTTLNLFESALKHLPPEVSDALRVLNQTETLTDTEYNSLVEANANLLKDD